MSNYRWITFPIPSDRRYLLADSDDGKYVKISDSFTGKTTDPTLYDWVKSEIEICHQEVKEEQKKRFLNLFNKNSLDGGKTSWMHITPYRYTDDISFKEKYIPEGFLKVCEKYNIYNYDLKDIFFIKKMDAHGKAVDIIVPNEFKGLVIGKKGQNIKCIAHLINAKRVNVI